MAGKKAPFLAADARRYREDWSYKTRRGPLSNTGRTVGIVGFSRIGRRVVRLAVDRLPDVTCLVVDPYADPAEVARAGAQLIGLAEASPRLDVLSIHYLQAARDPPPDRRTPTGPPCRTAQRSSTPRAGPWWTPQPSRPSAWPVRPTRSSTSLTPSPCVEPALRPAQRHAHAARRGITGLRDVGHDGRGPRRAWSASSTVGPHLGTPRARRGPRTHCLREIATPAAARGTVVTGAPMRRACAAGSSGLHTR